MFSKAKRSIYRKHVKDGKLTILGNILINIVEIVQIVYEFFDDVAKYI